MRLNIGASQQHKLNIGASQGGLAGLGLAILQRLDVRSWKIKSWWFR
jgi:hypothetical protein